MNGTNDCGAFVERLQREHREINGALADIRHRFAQLESSATLQAPLASLGDRLASLLEELKAHFAEEEQGGCMEEAVTRVPSTAADVNAILAEHPELAQQLATLVEAVKSHSQTVSQLQSNFEIFARQLKAHEVKENRLLQFALGGEAADYDTEGNE